MDALIAAHRSGNHLLDSLPEEGHADLLTRLQRVPMPAGTSVFRAGEPILDVHFPVRGVLSLVTSVDNGATIEVSTLGNEGTTGVPVFLEAESMPNVRCVAQVAGETLRMPADDFRLAVHNSAPLRGLMNRYTQALFAQIGQGVACSALHRTSQRCARWLLMTHDRAGADEFVLTHEFLAYMLGVRRASVTDAVGPFREAGIISYQRGHLKILDRARLESASCECYNVVRDAFTALLPPPNPVAT